MPFRLTAILLHLSACTSDADDRSYGAPGAMDFGDVMPPPPKNSDDETPIPLGLPDSYVRDAEADVAEAPDGIETDTGPADTSDCSSDVMVGGQLICL